MTSVRRARVQQQHHGSSWLHDNGKGRAQVGGRRERMAPCWQVPQAWAGVAVVVVRRELPACQVLMLTTFDDAEYIVEALRAGACGYLLKDIPAHELAQAVQAAHKGIYQLDPAVAAK